MAQTDIRNRSPDAARIAALDDLAILDTEPEPGFDDIVLLACQICGTPVSLVSLVAEDRQWFKARVGFPACETPLSQSVCSLALRHGGTFAVPDLAPDERTKDNALVTGEPFIRFYAGAPIHAREGVSIGTLCVIDTEPRPGGLTDAQTRGLEALARQLEARRLLAERAGAAAERLAAEAADRRRQELLSLELGHRLKNLLALVHSIAVRTLRGAEVPMQARSALLDRIRALGKAQDILLAGSAEAASMAALVRDAIEPHGHGARFRVSGPEVAVNAKAALMLALALHELSTNAAKYGALSSPGGRGGHRVVRRRGQRRGADGRGGLAGGRRPRGRAPAAQGLRHAPDRARLGGDGRRHRHAGIPSRRCGLPDRGAAVRLLEPRALTGPGSPSDADRAATAASCVGPSARRRAER
jgi:two-component sensor histidine kinase